MIPKWLQDRRDKLDGFVNGTDPNAKWGQYWPSRVWFNTKVKSNLTRDLAFNRHSINDGHHVSPSDNGQISVGTDDIIVKLVQGIDEDAFKRTLSAATRATIGIDLEQPAALDPNQDWEEMLKGGLQTALETQTIVFAVSGVSRTCTHQLVRSRRASFHQQSQRASYVGDQPQFRMPESVWRNIEVRELWIKALQLSHEAYRAACEADISYQDSRFVLNEGTTNFIMLEYPVREFLNVYAYRACSMFQWEIVDVMRKARAALVAAHPFLADYVKISCQDRKCPTCGGTGRVAAVGMEMRRCGECYGSGMLGSKCTFQGWEQVDEQCDFSWGREDNRVFRSDAHGIKSLPIVEVK